ncbi:hypothetical protein [Saccharothrix deserti]|uniref:hypothetical protein n=1 Tax=Saccharothrix deserti TaxID=2593674 RepID=UPI00131C20A7|nr:hypothetical protein [Saccharothrix deserti]
MSRLMNRAINLPALISADREGHVERYPGCREWVVHSARELLDIGIDGEAVRLPPPLRFRSLPAALRPPPPPRTARPTHDRAAASLLARGHRTAAGAGGAPAALTHGSRHRVRATAVMA